MGETEDKKRDTIRGVCVLQPSSSGRTSRSCITSRIALQGFRRLNRRVVVLDSSPMVDDRREEPVEELSPLVDGG